MCIGGGFPSAVGLRFSMQAGQEASMLSIGLRSRLVAAVTGGVSRRAAAERFGVSVAGAVRWMQALNTVGTVEAKPQGGDTTSHRIEALRDVILNAMKARRLAR